MVRIQKFHYHVDKNPLLNPTQSQFYGTVTYLQTWFLYVYFNIIFLFVPSTVMMMLLVLWAIWTLLKWALLIRVNTEDRANIQTRHNINN